MKPEEISALLDEVTILSGDGDFILFGHEAAHYGGDELCVVITPDGRISKMQMLGSYADHSAAEIQHMTDEERGIAADVILDQCDPDELAKSVSQLLTASEVK